MVVYEISPAAIDQNEFLGYEFLCIEEVTTHTFSMATSALGAKTETVS